MGIGTAAMAAWAYVGSAFTAVGAMSATFGQAVVVGAIVGATVGGLYQAVTGGNIGKGILFGAIGGAVIGGGASALGAFAGPTTTVAPMETVYGGAMVSTESGLATTGQKFAATQALTKGGTAAGLTGAQQAGMAGVQMLFSGLQSKEAADALKEQSDEDRAFQRELAAAKLKESALNREHSLKLQGLRTSGGQEAPSVSQAMRGAQALEQGQQAHEFRVAEAGIASEQALKDRLKIGETYEGVRDTSRGQFVQGPQTIEQQIKGQGILGVPLVEEQYAA